MQLHLSESRPDNWRLGGTWKVFLSR